LHLSGIFFNIISAVQIKTKEMPMKQSQILLSAIVLSFLSATVAVKVFSTTAVTPTLTTKTMDRILATNTLRCGYAVWPPGLLKDPNTSKLSGINYEIMEQIGRELDLKIDWVEEVGFGNFIEGMRNHRYDVMCTSVWPDAPRIRYLLYSNPTYYSPIYAYVRADDHRFDGNLQRINKDDVMIAAIDGDISQTQARIDFPHAKMFSLPQTAEGSEILLAVISKKADLVFSDKGNFNAFNKHNPGKLRAVSNVGPATIFAEPVAFLPEDTQLQSMVNLAIRNLVDNGKIDRILAKYPEGDYLHPLPTYKAVR
jgi:ABC-type amino acid transport substrate-binding protein